MPTSQLATYRRKKGLSQEQLASLSGVSARTIQRIEKNTVEAHPATLKMLADCLDVDPEQLLEKEPEPVIVPEVKTKNLLPLFHGMALIGLFAPILNILLPAFLWFFKKEEQPEYDRQGKLVVNFQLTMSIAFIPAVFLMVFYFPLGFPLVMFIYFFTMVMCVVNLFRSINSQPARYPLAYPFLR